MNDPKPRRQADPENDPKPRRQADPENDPKPRRQADPENDPKPRRQADPMNEPKRRRESGAAMFVAVLMLVLMGWMGMAAMNTVTRDNQVAGFQNRNQNAFFAAEAGVAYARAVVEHEIGDTSDLPGVGTVPAFPTQAAPAQISQVANYAEWQSAAAGNELPRYYGDPNPPDPTNPQPIHYFGPGEIMDGDDLQVGGTHRQGTLWRITVVGQSPAALGAGFGSGASTARLDVVTVKPMMR